MALFHYIDTITNTAGDALEGYYAKLQNAAGAYVALYSDASSTPISVVSGVTDTAVSDDRGRISIYVAEGTYTLNIFDKNDSDLLIDSIASIPMIAQYSVVAGDYVSVETHDALRALTPADADIVVLATHGIPSRTFIFDASDRSTQVTRDPTGIATVAPTSDLTGASGAWRLIYDGTIYAEWSDEYSSASDATDACQAAWEYLVISGTDAKAWKVYQTLTTYGFGDQNYMATYATKALADAALAGLSEYDVVKVTTDETQSNATTLYRVRSAAYVQIQNRGLNGKRIFADTVAKTAGFKLKGQSSTWMGLLKCSGQDSIIERIWFNGQQTSSQWPGAALAENPNTDTLVYLEGYGWTWNDNMVRFFANQGFYFHGIIGNLHITGGDCVCQYGGRGWVFGQGASIKASKLWGEGNDEGDVLLKHDMTAASVAANPEQLTYMRESCIEIESIYSENELAAATIVEIQGGVFAPKIGTISRQSSGTGDERYSIHLKNNPDADETYIGCQAGVFDLGGHTHIIKCESESRNNIFYRQANTWTSVDQSQWVFENAGRDNMALYKGGCPNAYIPGADPGTVTLTADSTSFIDGEAGSTGTTAVVDGSRLHPVLDTHADYATGPGFVRCSNMETILGGGTVVTISGDNNFTLPASIATYWLCLMVEFEAHQTVQVVLTDVTPAPDELYNWDTQIWEESGGVNEDPWGTRYVLIADRRSMFYQIEVVNPTAQARDINVQLRILGSGTADLHHAWMADIKNSEPYVVMQGQYMGTPSKPMCPVASLPTANIPVGTQFAVSDADTPVLGATVAAGAGADVQVGVRFDGTNWKVG